MMRQRPLGISGLHASEVGLGCEHLQDKPLALITEVIDAAIAGGINIMDVFMSEPEVRTNIGIALKGRRDKVILQGHIGAAWRDGQYERTREPEAYRFHFKDFMQRLQTDYVDIGMLHFVDTQADFDKVIESGMLDYAVQLKRDGVIRATGVSSHDPVIAQKLVETGQIDVLMFSINPAYDILPAEVDIDGLFNDATYAAQASFQLTPERAALYRTCESRGVGITVMKALGGGLLLNAQRSPYGTAMHVHQCMHYALTRPAVASVMVGCQSVEHVQEAIAYETATDEARDYTGVLKASAKFSLAGNCVYCNHCLPCPVGIDVALVNKYLDLAKQADTVPETVEAHYRAMGHCAADCIRCGQCEGRCPFAVPVIQRMQEAVAVFHR